MELPCRRFGRTNIKMPVLSLGGMRFQKSWEELNSSEISHHEQKKIENILKLANKYGFSHVETAKYYGTSEVQLGMGFKSLDKVPRILQTKIPPNSDSIIFEEYIKFWNKNNYFLGLSNFSLITKGVINN